MDLQAQIAARRAELARLSKEAEARHKLETTKQMEVALDSIATELSTQGVPVVRHGDELALTAQPLPPLDIEGLTRLQIDQLIKREARKLWTPGENWLVISLISGGICLIHLAGIGLIPVVIGMGLRRSKNMKYRSNVLERYPQLLRPWKPTLLTRLT